jgi:predicted nucleic acid-binding protein
VRAYLDSSAVFKLAHEERETLALIEYLDEGAMEVSTSVVGEIEVLRHLRRRQLQTDGALTGFYLIGLDDDVRKTATEVGAGALRALDAIHIATALSIDDRELQFVTYEQRQAESALLAGLRVVQPGR